jgi:hypothetical protein
MGAAFDYRVYDSDNKQDIQKCWLNDRINAINDYIDNYLFDNEDASYEDASYEDAMDNIGYSGEINTLEENIKWIRVTPFSSEREAADYISINHKKWEDPIGVPFMNGKDINYAVGGWCST